MSIPPQAGRQSLLWLPAVRMCPEHCLWFGCSVCNISHCCAGWRWKNERLKKASFKILCQKLQGLLFSREEGWLVKELQVCRGGDVVPRCCSQMLFPGPVSGVGVMDKAPASLWGRWARIQGSELIPLIGPSVFAVKNEISSTLLAPFKVKLYIF